MTTQLTMDLDATAAKTTTAAAPNAGAVKAHHNRHNRRTAVAAIRERAAAKVAKAKQAAKAAPKADKTAKVAKVAKTAAPHEDILAILNRHAAEVASFAPFTVEESTTAPCGVKIIKSRIDEWVEMRARQKAEIAAELKRDAEGVFRAVIEDCCGDVRYALFRLNINYEVAGTGVTYVPFFVRREIYAAWKAAGKACNCTAAGTVAAGRMEAR